MAASLAIEGVCCWHAVPGEPVLGQIRMDAEVQRQDYDVAVDNVASVVVDVVVVVVVTRVIGSVDAGGFILRPAMFPSRPIKGNVWLGSRVLAVDACALCSK